MRLPLLCRLPGIDPSDFVFLHSHSAVRLPLLCRLPGIDPSDFFNYGLNERGWRDYCARVAQYRLEFTMKGQIQVGCCIVWKSCAEAALHHKVVAPERDPSNHPYLCFHHRRWTKQQQRRGGGRPTAVRRTALPAQQQQQRVAVLWAAAPLVPGLMSLKRWELWEGSSRTRPTKRL